MSNKIADFAITTWRPEDDEDEPTEVEVVTEYLHPGIVYNQTGAMLLIAILNFLTSQNNLKKRDD